MIVGELFSYGPVKEHVDLIEITHVYNKYSGEEQNHQVIIYEWYPDENKYHVRDWSVFRPEKNNTEYGKNHKNGKYFVKYTDRHNIQRDLNSYFFIETSGTIDREIRDGKIFDRNQRISLIKKEKRLTLP
jgi:hypothetical protein